MSELHTSLVQQEMEESGEMDFIRQHVAAQRGEEAPAPAAEADTVEVPEVEEAPADSTEEEIPADVGTEDSPELTAEEEEVLYLELDDDTQALIDSKYDGDINKALTALREGQSLIGRQGNELGAVRAELEQLRQEMTQGFATSQPYPEWPDEFAEPSEAASQLRRIAEAAFQRRDVDTFQTALGAWEQVDEVSVANYRDLKEMQVAASMAQQQAPVQDDEATLTAGVEAIRVKYPQFQDESFQAAVAAELDKTPSLKAVLWQGVPGVSPQERLNVLDEAAARVLARTTSETATQAKRRIAVRTSEEARAARVAAQSVRGQSARESEPEVEARTLPMGDSGRALNLDRMNAMLPPEDRI